MTRLRFSVLALIGHALAGEGVLASASQTVAETWVAAPFQNAPLLTAEEGAWWRKFGDPVLTDLVERAVAANLDVRVAQERVTAARAGERAQRSRLWPAINLQASASDTSTRLPEPVKQGIPDTRALRAGAELAWELDLAGGLRAARRASHADAMAVHSGLAGARLLAASEVARQYFILRGAQERLRIVEQLAAAQRETEGLVRSREREGLASRFDVSRAVGEADALEAEVPALRTLVGVTQSRIAVLLGESPSVFAVAPLSSGWPEQIPIGAGQSSDLLRRRPDLMAAEARFAAATMRRDEARAQWWPKLFLSALAGQQDLQLNALDLSPARFSGVGLAFSLPLFSAGRIHANVKAQTAHAGAALVEWQRAVLVAVEEVENSLLARTQERARGESLNAAAEARRQSLAHAQSLRREGQIDLLLLLDVQRVLLASELALAESRTQQALNDVQLYKALGGGWNFTDSTNTSTSGDQ